LNGNKITKAEVGAKMNIIVVDDEHLTLKNIGRTIKDALQIEPVCFVSPNEALAWAESNRVDIAFLDIEMGGMSGLELAKRLKEIQGKTNIVFVTAYSEYAMDAFTLYASGYILKPATREAIIQAVEELRYPPSRQRTAKKIRVQAFGNFEVFAGDTPLYFPRSKAKELFAYLVHKKGTSATTAELTAVLFEYDLAGNASLRKQIQTIISTMRKVLRQAGAEDAIIKRTNSLQVDAEKIDCDFYRFLQGDTEAVNAYTGEYMHCYSWADFTLGYLDDKMKKL